MNFNEILAQLQKNVYQPIYFLMGEETYFIDEICNYITAHALDDSEREFNQTTLYGKDTDVGTIIAQAKRFPLRLKIRHPAAFPYQDRDGEPLR